LSLSLNGAIAPKPVLIVF